MSDTKNNNNKKKKIFSAGDFYKNKKTDLAESIKVIDGFLKSINPKCVEIILLNRKKSEKIKLSSRTEFSRLEVTIDGEILSCNKIKISDFNDYADGAVSIILEDDSSVEPTAKAVRMMVTKEEKS